MPRWDYDSKDYNPDGHFSVIPPGDYRVRIEDAEDTVSKAGNDMVKLTLTVSGKRNKLWYYIVFPDQSDPNFARKKQLTNQKLGELWESFDMTVGDLNVLNWRGKVGAARIKQEQDNGEMRNAISYFLTRKRQQDLPAWVEPGGSPASSASSAPSMSLRNEVADLPF